MSDKTIYDLKLHEFIHISESVQVRRVPGGWLWEIRDTFGKFNIVFVKFDNEFNTTKLTAPSEGEFEMKEVEKSPLRENLAVIVTSLMSECGYFDVHDSDELIAELSKCGYEIVHNPTKKG